MNNHNPASRTQTSGNATLFSIVTPSFNQLDWLRLCVASVKDQVANSGKMVTDANENSQTQIPESTTQPLSVEHIIQDAGSQGIEDFARQVGADFYRDGHLIFEGQHGIKNTNSANNSHLQTPTPPPRYRLTVYCERDTGMYDAVNRGFARAAGEFLAYLNCDEQYVENALQTVVGFFKTLKQTDVIFGDAIIIDAHGKALSYRQSVVPTLDLMRCGPLGVLTCATFVRASSLDRTGIHFDGTLKIVGDYKWYAAMITNNLQMKCVSRLTSVFTLLPNNLSKSQHAKIEGPNWNESDYSTNKFFQHFVLLFYYLRKLFSGHYFPKPCYYSIFLACAPSKRTRHKKLILGSRWPSLS